MKQRLLAAYATDDGFIACNLVGEEQPIDLTLITERNAEFLRVREQAKSCLVWELPILDKHIYKRLRSNIQSHISETSPMYIHALRAYTVNIVETIAGGIGHESSVFFQSDGRVKCHSTTCRSRNKFNCKHVRFVTQVVPRSAVEPAPSDEDYSDLIDE